MFDSLKKTLVVLVTLGTISGGLAITATSVRAESLPYQIIKDQILTVLVGPNNDMPCNISYDLYIPNEATLENPVPAILTTNGFGGSKEDLAGMGKFSASHGYEALAYSGLGFGKSTCQIELDDPNYDGKAASQLITFLGSRDEVLKDHKGYLSDPRVGMVGGSYGGAVQLATASIDPRLDAIIPMITWNDLSYSLAPNNLITSAPVVPPGVLKYEWVQLFFAIGARLPTAGVGATPSATAITFPPCPGFDVRVCPADLSILGQGYPSVDTIKTLQAASMVSFYKNIHTPTMLVQGEADSLFNINEAVNSYNELKSNNVPVKLVLQSWGHSSSTPAPGEIDFNNPNLNQYETRLMFNWLNHYLKDSGESTGAEIEYFRNWVSYDGSAQPAYGQADNWPIANSQELYLSADGKLVPTESSVKPGNVLLNNAATAPANGLENSISFITAPANRAVDIVGVPSVTFNVMPIASSLENAVLATTKNPAKELVLFGKLYDIAPDGTRILVQRLVSAMRIADTSQPVTMQLPGIVHRFEAGHQLKLVISTKDNAYISSNPENQYLIKIDKAHQAQLSFPIANGVDVYTVFSNVNLSNPDYGTHLSPLEISRTFPTKETILLAILSLLFFGVVGFLYKNRKRLFGARKI